MSYYLPTLLISSVGLTNELARLIAAVSAVVYLIASAVAAPLVERCGRRVMMMVSTALQLISFFMMTILLYYAQKPGYAGQHKVPEATIVWFFIYYIGFGLGMLGIPWLYPTEINSLPMRTKASAIATVSKLTGITHRLRLWLTLDQATDWLTTFIVVEITPIGLQTLGWKFYIIFTVLNTAFLPIIYFLYPLSLIHI